MKIPLMTKILMVLPLILFVDYLIMVLLGCASCLVSFGDGFYCGTYCIIGKIVLLLSLVFFGYLIYPDISSMLTTSKNGQTQEKPEDR